MVSASPGAVLITGAASGIGRACALHLARHGFHVVATTRRSPAETAQELGSELPSGARIDIVAMDADSDISVGEAVARVEQLAGCLEGVVHCAGFGIGGAVEDTDDDEARRIFETNVLGVLRVCRAVLPAMRRQGGGRLLVISSLGGRIALPFQGLYSATKFAVEGLCEALSMEVRPYGIDVVLVEPGDFRTGFTDRRRTARRVHESSPYRDAFERALAIVEHDERGASTPEVIARLVERILRARSPRLRYTIGPSAQRLAVQLKKLLPGRAFERVLSSYYHVRPPRRAQREQGKGSQHG